MTNTYEPSPKDNILLACLPVDLQERLFPKLELLALPLGKVIYESGDEMRFVYFPTNSIISLLYVTESGASAEIALVGCDGVAGISAFMGGGSTQGRAAVQSAGSAYRLPTRVLMDEFNGPDTDFRALMLRYTQALISQMAQTAVCNRHHSIAQQLCRWLLLSLDRLEGNQLVMTHELIANMLGVRREGVTEAAGKLQRAGLIKYHRGKITVLDRGKLEKMSCECYAVVKKETDRLAAQNNTIAQHRLPSGAVMTQKKQSVIIPFTERRVRKDRRCESAYPKAEKLDTTSY
ncbi:MAG: Crp/Fnr family transcriptional regulator [Alcanivoracaceae bacterium]